MRLAKELHISTTDVRRNPSLDQAAMSPTTGIPESPLSPTFSLRHSASRYTPSTSIASSPAVRASLDGFSKMPLAEVKEENGGELVSRDQDFINNDEHPSAFPDYDWLDTPSYEGADLEFVVHKRRCAESSQGSSLSSRLTGRFPSFGRIKTRRTSSMASSLHEAFVSRSRASSLRSPSVLDRVAADIPPHPVYQESVDTIEAMQLEEADDEPVEEERILRAQTPLLPPALAVQQQQEEPIQSPLQSPSVDATASLTQSPFDSPNASQYLPSPPLSTKPSMASFHHRSILPVCEIPIIHLTEGIQDEWAMRLGHENFTILPEPYQLAAPATLDACQRLKADWELAKSQFDLHLARIGQVYNETSKVYHLTLVKWADINLRWKCYHEQALEAVPRISQETLQASQLGQEPAQVIKERFTLVAALPPTPPMEAKFPTPPASGLIGPMERAQPMIPRSCRKRSFWKFLQGVWGTVQA